MIRFTKGKNDKNKKIIAVVIIVVIVAMLLTSFIGALR